MRELPKETLEWFGGDELRARVFIEKYALRNKRGEVLEKTPPEMWDRVAREIASVEETEEKRKEWEERFRWLLDDFKFIPGGRIMFGAGQKDRRATLMNCYVIPIKEDSLEGIYETMKEMARTYSLGGGVGIDISNLRPKGARVNNSAYTSTGAVSFMNLFSLTTGTIGQNGRRGALMITIHCAHPDVLDFITIKNDPLRMNVKYANISVLLTDEFMEAVQKDENWELWYPDKLDKEEIIEEFGTDNFDEIVAMLKKDSRAVLFDINTRMFYHYPDKTYFILKDKGEVRKRRVYRVVKAREVWDRIIENAWASAEPGVIMYSSMLKSSTSEYNGMNVLTTNPCVVGDTRIFTAEGLARMDSLAKQGREFTAVFDRRVEDEKSSGCDVAECTPVYITKRKAEVFELTTRRGYSITATKEHEFYLEEGGRVVKKALKDMKVGDVVLLKSGEGRWGSWGSFEEGYNLAKNTIVASNEEVLRDAKIPEIVMLGKEETFLGYLSAVIDLRGVEIKGKLEIEHPSKTFLKQLQMLLLNLGVMSVREDRIVRIEGEDLDVIKEKLQRRKNKGGGVAVVERVERRADFTDVVAKIEAAGIADVYDTTQNRNHTLVLNGFVTSNCSEIPLEPYGACCLGNINLERFVTNEFREDAEVDWQNLEKALVYAVRFLDNVIEYNKDRHPLTLQSMASIMGRRIGVGFTGLGDMLIKLRIKYDTEEAIDFVNDLFNRIKIIVYNASVELAREKGAFPKFDKEQHLKMGFIKKLPKDLQEKIREYGVRNVGLLTVPPVGSGAILAGVTSGVEPVFALSYLRTSDSLSQKVFKVYHPLAKKYMEMHGLQDEDELPEFFVTAHKINPYFRVKMQATIQKHIDHSISSTVNLPEETTKQTISDIYFYAWKLGCKGITVYREGSREGVLKTKEEDDKEKEEKKQRYVRPRKLLGETIKLKLGGDVIYTTVNKDENEVIREVIINMGKSGGKDRAVAEALGRIISIYLQEGGDVREIIKQLDEIKSDETYWDQGIVLHSIPDAVSKAIKMAIGDISERREIKSGGGEGSAEISNAVECPECKKRSFVNENGCWVCKNCGYTKCS